MKYQVFLYISCYIAEIRIAFLTVYTQLTKNCQKTLGSSKHTFIVDSFGLTAAPVSETSVLAFFTEDLIYVQYFEDSSALQL